jgi:tetratricopeptide (TPR) repeat protein
LALDPVCIEALVGRANVDETIASALLADDPAPRLAAAEATLNKALSLAPQHALAHLMLGIIQILTYRAAQGIAECERALALDRNLAHAHAWIGLAKMFIGRATETEAHVLEAFRLSPRDTRSYIWLLIAGLAKLHLNADREAVACYAVALRPIEIIRSGNSGSPPRWLGLAGWTRRRPLRGRPLP